MFRTLFRFCLCCLALAVGVALAGIASAADATPQCRQKAIGVVVNNLDLTGDRSFTLTDASVNANAASSASYSDHLAYYQHLSIETHYAYGNGGVLTWTCVGTVLADGSPVATLTTTTVASGVATTNWSGAIASPSLSAAKNWITRLDLGGVRAIKCTAHLSGSPSSSDKITAIALVWGC